MKPFERHVPNLDAYHERGRNGPCFVCGIVGRDPHFPGHHTVHEDDRTIAFFSRWPTQYRYTLVALMLETAGALEVPEDEKAALAGRVRRRLQRKEGP